MHDCVLGKRNIIKLEMKEKARCFISEVLGSYQKIQSKCLGGHTHPCRPVYCGFGRSFILNQTVHINNYRYIEFSTKTGLYMSHVTIKPVFILGG